MQILRMNEIVKMTGTSKSTIWRWLKGENHFPKPIKLSNTSIGWVKSEVEAWLDSKIQARDSEV